MARVAILHGEGIMEEFEIEISDSQYATLNRQFPAKENSYDIGRRAVEFLKVYFKTLDPDAQIRPGEDGSDLEITRGGKTESVEVKGTASSDISWGTLKVSSQASYDCLRDGAKLYRVMRVNSSKPKVCVLTEGEDFEMVPEPRWAVRKI
jgi:hypothetical protein